MRGLLTGTWLLLCLMAGGAFCYCHAQQNVAVSFEVIPETGVSSGDTIYITGNQESLGDWNPHYARLDRYDGVWKGQWHFPVGTALEFKFTKGSWNAEAVTRDGRPPGNYSLLVQSDTILRYTIPFWKDSIYNTQPAISGDYRVHDAFPVQGLASRRVIVWLPPSYATDSTRRYPVLYAQDGQNVFDPYTSTLGHDWRMDEVIDSLVRAGEMEEIICVAIYCNPDVREKEYSDDPDLGEKYQDFMCCQLKPWIDSVYRTMPEPAHTAVIGASMGGMISFILGWEYQNVFGMAACLSPALKMQLYGFNLDYVSDVSQSDAPPSLILYMDNGTEGIDALLQPGVEEMMHVLDKKGAPYSWYHDVGAPHNEIAWAQRVWRPLLLFFNKK